MWEARNTMFGSSTEKAGLHRERRMELMSRENNRQNHPASAGQTRKKPC